MLSLRSRLQQRASIGLVSALALSCSAAASGCGEKPTQASAVARQAEPARADDDRALLAEIENLRSVCALDEKTRLLSCTEAEEGPGVRLMKDEAARLEALPTLARLLGDTDEKRRLVAERILKVGYSTKLGDALRVGDIDKNLANSLLEALSTLPVNEAREITPVAVHAAMLSGQAKVLHTILAARAELKKLAYVRIMVHGRLEALPELKAAAAGDDPELAATALEATRYMRDWTAEEQDVLCPWALGYFEQPPWPRAARAVQALTNCRGRHADALLERGRALHAEGKLTRLGVEAFRQICLLEPSDSPRCDQTLAFLASLLETPGNAAPKRLRSGAIAMMTAQAKGIGEKKTPRHQLALRVARKYSADSDPDVVREAQRLLARVDPPKPPRASSDSKKL